ncbi:MAG: restriction endonuclease [Pasteurellaceae bacterium]|nr:restriction endonuclease [Pasteurellaceae bacterium]
MSRVWMVRSDGGILYDFFKEHSVVGIGWDFLAEKALNGASRKELIEYYNQLEPNLNLGKKISAVSQVFRFINNIKPKCWVVTYSPINRTYLIGKVTGDSKYTEDWRGDNLSIIKSVVWEGKEILRDDLTPSTRNSLGGISTVFELSEKASEELINLLNEEPLVNNIEQDESEQDVEDDIFKEVELKAFEKIKDLINQLDWKDMQELVAGVLRAMGYKTQISPNGSDRGKDIMASPDGFGFETPRIIVEVKHRSATPIGSQEIRSFLGGRHQDDRGLYVSTGGFSKDAKYEADRAKIPLVLWSLDELARTLIQHYDDVDTSTKQLIPLKISYLPIK